MRGVSSNVVRIICDNCIIRFDLRGQVTKVREPTLILEFSTSEYKIRHRGVNGDFGKFLTNWVVFDRKPTTNKQARPVRTNWLRNLNSQIVHISFILVFAWAHTFEKYKIKLIWLSNFIFSFCRFDAQGYEASQSMRQVPAL